VTARVLLCVSLLVAGAGRAEAGDHTARRLRRAALAAYEAGDYAAAARDFRASYDLDPDPELLYAIGQALRLSGDCAGAVEAYSDFLIRLPDDAQASAAREKIQTCEAILAPPAAGKTAARPPRPARRPIALPLAPPRPSRGSWLRDPLGGALLAGGVAAAATGSWLWIDGDRAGAGGLLVGGGAGMVAAAVLRYALVRRDRRADEEDLGPNVSASVGPGTVWVSGHF
jgi:tetratricopeptide (TPR) repeat protein